MLDADHFKKLEEIYSTMDFRRYFEAGRNRFRYIEAQPTSNSTVVNKQLVYYPKDSNTKEELMEKFRNLDEVDRYAFLRGFIRNNILNLWGQENNPYKSYKLFDNIMTALEAYLFMVKYREYDNITRMYATGTTYTASGTYTSFNSGTTYTASGTYTSFNSSSSNTMSVSFSRW